MRDEILAAVKLAGIVGAGGAGFPAHIKINTAVDVVIANGAECEPLLRADQQLMAVETMKFIVGLRTVMYVTGAQRGVVGIKRKYEPAVQAISQTLESVGCQDIELVFIPDFYPAGDEQVLVYEITGKIVPEGGIPLQVGAVVSNVQTLINIANALEGKPVTAKFVTVTGAVRKPVTLHVPIGLRFSELIKLAGGALAENYAIIEGGPMMGKLAAADQVVTKTTGGIILLPDNHSLVVQKRTPWRMIANRAKAACCSCMACTDMCPRHLLGHSLQPHRIMQAIGKGNVHQLPVLSQAFLCSECGACDNYVCTMGLSPRRINAEIKRQLMKQGVKNPHHAAPAVSSSSRKYRRIPTKRLLARLGLESFDRQAPLMPDIVPAREVTLLLSQHIGAVAMPVVSIGQSVKQGELVAAIPAGAALGANLHASIDGVVTAVNAAITIQKDPPQGG